MNDVTKRLLDGLLKLKHIKPKTQSVSKVYDLEQIFIRGELYEFTDDNYCLCRINLVGYIDFGESLQNLYVQFPKEICFDLEYKLKIARTIDFQAINNEMGYEVFQPTIIEYFNSDPVIKNHDKKAVEVNNQCICKLDQLMYKGCICGGK
jgi:hypothetical protein